MSVLEVSEERIVLKTRIVKSGERYAITFPAAIAEAVKRLHNEGREVEVIINIKGGEEK